MKTNNNLHDAKRAGKYTKDEFYTMMSDIESELQHYTEHFKGKTVFCNCDDPFESNFFKYFALNFNKLKLKKLISLSYPNSKAANGELVFVKEKNDFACHIEINEVPEDIDCKRLRRVVAKAKFEGDVNKFRIIESYKGDFRSQYSINLLKEADIVCTNPPFSLFREYMSLLVKYNKQFLILGNKNAITYKEIFPLIKEEKLWLGYNSPKNFLLPVDGWKNLKETRRVAGLCRWFTNLETVKKHVKLDLCCKYDPLLYPKYDNYDAINVDKISEIPYDYDGAMGVPISFMDKFNPEQFEIKDANDYRKNNLVPLKAHGLIKDKEGAVNGKNKYARILIKKNDKMPMANKPLKIKLEKENNIPETPSNEPLKVLIEKPVKTPKKRKNKKTDKKKQWFNDTLVILGFGVASTLMCGILGTIGGGALIAFAGYKGWKKSLIMYLLFSGLTLIFMFQTWLSINGLMGLLK